MTRSWQLKKLLSSFGFGFSFLPSSNSLSSLAEKYLQVFPFQIMRGLWNPELLLQNLHRIFVFKTFQHVNDYFFFSCSPASYSQPILSGPIRNSDSTGEEVIFSCRSGNGYPKPIVYWINKTDNSRLPSSEPNITLHDDGTYSVFSTLKVKATSNMQIECFIENKILQENLSANCKSLHCTSCFLDSRNINQCLCR